MEILLGFMGIICGIVLLFVFKKPLGEISTATHAGISTLSTEVRLAAMRRGNELIEEFEEEYAENGYYTLEDIAKICDGKKKKGGRDIERRAVNNPIRYQYQEPPIPMAQQRQKSEAELKAEIKAEMMQEMQQAMLNTLMAWEEAKAKNNKPQQ